MVGIASTKVGSGLENLTSSMSWCELLQVQSGVIPCIDDTAAAAETRGDARKTVGGGRKAPPVVL